jgi:hypothetical protein
VRRIENGSVELYSLLGLVSATDRALGTGGFNMTNEMRAAVAGGVVTTALVGLFAAGHNAGLTETTAYALAVATGLVIYGVVSGRLIEFSGGGLSAKLTTIVHTEIDMIPVSKILTKTEMDEIFNIPKGSITQLRNTLKGLKGDHPIVLSLKLGASDKLEVNNLQNVRNHMAALSVYRSFRFVLFVTHDNVLQAYVPAATLTRLLRKGDPNVDGDRLKDEQDAKANELKGEQDAKANELITAINQGAINELLAQPGVTAARLRSNETNLAALDKMTQENLDAIVVTDSGGHPKGVIDRSQLLTKLLLAMVKSPLSP